MKALYMSASDLLCLHQCHLGFYASTSMLLALAFDGLEYY